MYRKPRCSGIGAPPKPGWRTEPGLCDLAPKTCDAVLYAKCTTDNCLLHALALEGKLKAKSPALLPLGAFRQSILEPRSARENGNSVQNGRNLGISHSRAHRSSAHTVPRRFAFLLARIAAYDCPG